MKVSELIEKLKELDQDLRIEVAMLEGGQSKDLFVSVEKFRDEQYVCISDWE